MRNAEVIRQWKILKTIEAGRFTSSAKLGRASTGSPSGRSAATSRRCRRRASRSTTTARTGRRSGGWSRATSRGSTQSFTPLRAGRPLLQPEHAVVPGRGALRARTSSRPSPRSARRCPQKSLPYLSRIQDLFSARPDPWKDYSKKQDVIAGLIDAILHQRQARIAYYSFNSRRTKSYDARPVPPRLLPRRALPLRARPRVRRGAHLRGRADAEGRGARPGLRDAGRLQPLRVRALAPSASSGGRRETVELVFDAAIAGYIRERNWHESQTPRGRARRRGAPDAWRSPRASTSRPGSRASCRTSRWSRPASLREEIARELEAARAAFPARPAGRG